MFLFDDRFYEFRYDADTASMQVTVPAQKTGTAELRMVNVKRRTLAANQYIGQNVFGVKKLISSAAYDILGSAEDGNSVISFGRGASYDLFHDARFDWAMDAVSAKSLKPNLRLAIAGAIISPEIVEYSDDHSPTISEPYETIYHHNLRFSTSELLALDTRSGSVVYRWNAATTPKAIGASRKDDFVVRSHIGDFIFRNLKVFGGCPATGNSPSEMAGVLISPTGAIPPITFLLTAHGFAGLAQDVAIPLTFQEIGYGEHPFDISLGHTCNNAIVEQGRSVKRYL